MPRSRGIKPAFFTDEKLVELPYQTRLLFIGLWCLADREGRLKDRAKSIKMQIFPADNVDVEASLVELDGAKLITRYLVGGERYIQVVNFKRHQNPHRREARSELPPPPDWPNVDPAPAIGATEPGKGPAKDKPKPRRRRTGTEPEPAEGFAEFWAAYPKKQKKIDAIAAWNDLAPDRSLQSVILAALVRQAKQADWKRENGRYIPQPAAYLNKRRWEDEEVVLNGHTETGIPETVAFGRHNEAQRAGGRS